MAEKPALLHEVFLLLGSNLGDRSHHLQEARELIRFRIGEIILASAIYQTEPWHVEGHDVYLNQVIHVRSVLPPGRLMNACLQIERALGRRRSKGIDPRTIDIDVLYYDDRVVHQKRVTIPHPRLHLRRFTLIPLNEVAPDQVHPVFGMTNRQLLEICEDKSEVKRFGKGTQV